MSELLPDLIDSEEELDQLLTTPSAALQQSIKNLTSPLVVIGAGGKMGPSLCVLAKRAALAAGHDLEVVAASRFRDHSQEQWLEQRGVSTQRCDVFDRDQLAQLPDSQNVMYLVGMKFGTSTDPVPTWATNTIAPMLTAQRFAGSRIVALSTGNVYPLVDAQGSGAKEDSELTPLGEYANAAVARERIFQYYARDFHNPSPTVLLRLNYAHDLRYGVMSDIAMRVWNRQSVDTQTGYFNAIWQGDANEIALRAFELCASPAVALNLTSTSAYSVRETAECLAQLLDRDPKFAGLEQSSALLSDASLMREKFGEPRVNYSRMLAWIAHWTRVGGRTLNKPTHYESRDGKY